MNAPEIMAAVAASLFITVGLILVIFHKPFSRRVKRERERLGVHVGTESHPTMLVVVGIGFVIMSVVVLVGTFPDVLAELPGI